MEDGVHLPKYRGMLNTVVTIAMDKGLLALWKGIVPGLHRQCSYGGLRIGLYEPVSFECVTLLMNLIYLPFYQVKSRMMGDTTYKSTLHCFIKTLKNEGPFAFYKGFLPNFGRLGSWNGIMFLTLEQVKKFFRREREV